LVNAVIRSPEVEHLHTSEQVTFLDNQFGTLCLNWAAVSLLDELLDPADPPSWGVELPPTDGEYFCDAGHRFPVAAAQLVTLGQLADSGELGAEAALPDTGSAEEAAAWLADHAGPGRDLDLEKYALPFETAIATERHAWTAPSPDELEEIRAHAWLPSGLTRLSRDPRHLAAVMQWATRTETIIMSANTCFEQAFVGLRHPLLPAPEHLPKQGAGPQASHQDSWSSLAGLDRRHARLVRGAFPAARPRLGRNDPCWCGSGRKHKYCHGA
jgi:hypothetical protein